MKRMMLLSLMLTGCTAWDLADTAAPDKIVYGFDEEENYKGGALHWNIPQPSKLRPQSE